MPHPPRIRSLLEQLPAWDERPLQQLVKAMAWVAGAALALAIVHNLAYDSTLPALICALALFPTAVLAQPDCPLPSTRRAIVLSATLITAVGAILVTAPDGNRDVTIMTLPAVLLVAALTVNTFAYAVLAVLTILMVIVIGCLEILGLKAGHAPALTGWRSLLDVVMVLAGCATAARLVSASLLQALRRLHLETLVNAQTGLPNRLALERVANDFLGGETAGSVLAIAIRRLESLDSTFGHAFGDAVIRHAAAIIAAHTGNDCFAGRWGENTFILLCRHPQGADTPRRCAHDIRDELRKAHLIDGVEVHLDADCGACTASESRLRLRPRERIERALIALDEARRSGNDVLTEYDESLSQRISAEYRYESALRQAIENDRVQMVYQPILTADGQQVIALEALLRLTGEDTLPVPTNEAIALAEASGLIHRLGRTILRAVLADIAGWRRAGASPLPTAVNFSALQLARPGIDHALAGYLAEHGLGPEALIAEVTESAFTADNDTLSALEGSGVPLAIDDFGVGYSTLARLLDMPAELIKFDSSLIHGAEHSAAGHEFLRRTVHLAHATGARVLIEGVESATQAVIAAGLGCYAVQGFWYAKPMPADAIPAFLATRDIADFRPRHPRDRRAAASRQPAPNLN